jgi:hypothetical protein
VWTDDILNLSDPEASSLLGKNNGAICPPSTLIQNDQFFGSSLVVDARSTAGECRAQFFYQRPDTEASIAGSPESDAYINATRLLGTYHR